MVTTEQEYVTTQDRVRQFTERLDRLEALPDTTPGRASRLAGTRNQLATLQRELAMWDAGIHEPVPGTLQYERVAEDIEEQDAALLLKRAEIANIDRQIGLVLDRIADWRRHRAWLEREIAELEASAIERQPQESLAD